MLLRFGRKPCARPLSLFGRKPAVAPSPPTAVPGSAASSETLVAMFETSVERFGPQPLFGVHRTSPEPGYDWQTWTYAATGHQVPCG